MKPLLLIISDQVRLITSFIKRWLVCLLQPTTDRRWMPEFISGIGSAVEDH